METNKPTVAIFDLDGTITNRDTFLAYLLGFLLANPREIFRSLHLPFAVLLYALKVRDNSWLKVKFLRSILGNKPTVSIDYWTSRFVENMRRNGYRPGALKCLGEHKRKGHRLVLATASPDFYVRPLVEPLGFDDIICIEVEWNTERQLALHLKRGNCYGSNKLESLKARGYLSEKYYTVAYSDHHSDLLLLIGANTGIAVHPTRKLKQVADCNDIEIAYWNL